MITEIIYRANDGTPFQNRQDCLDHEASLVKAQQERVMKEITELGEIIWKKYHPEYELGSKLPPLDQAHIWLKNDVGATLSYVNQDLNLLKEEILEIVNANKYGELILKRYLPIDALLEEANIRRDYAAALSKVRRGSDLSSKLEWSFGPEDLQKLAMLHQKNKYRVKIEDLLTDCNFHYECSQFTSHKYEEFLNPKEGGQE